MRYRNRLRLQCNWTTGAHSKRTILFFSPDQIVLAPDCLFHFTHKFKQPRTIHRCDLEGRTLNRFIVDEITGIEHRQLQFWPLWDSKPRLLLTAEQSDFAERIRVWNAETSSVLRTFARRFSRISAAFNRIAVLGRRYQTIRVFDAETGLLVAKVQSAGFNGDLKRMVFISSTRLFLYEIGSELTSLIALEQADKKLRPHRTLPLPSTIAGSYGIFLPIGNCLLCVKPSHMEARIVPLTSAEENKRETSAQVGNIRSERFYAAKIMRVMQPPANLVVLAAKRQISVLNLNGAQILSADLEEDQGEISRMDACFSCVGYVANGVHLIDFR